MTKPKVTVIRQTFLIEAEPEFVFDTYVDPKKHAEFTGSPATGKAKVGGTFTAWDGYITGKYVELARGKKIVHEWTTTGWPEGSPPSLVDITLRKVGKKTELTMLHSNVPVGLAEGFTEGWPKSYWEPLKKYVKDRSS